MSIKPLNQPDVIVCRIRSIGFIGFLSGKFRNLVSQEGTGNVALDFNPNAVDLRANSNNEWIQI